MPIEKRKYTRIGTLNLLSYICLDDKGNAVRQGMGRSLNVSEGGILLETHAPIETQFIILLNIGFKENLFEVRGRVVYCRAIGTGMFNSGVEFKDISKKEKSMLQKYIKAFNENFGNA